MNEVERLAHRVVFLAAGRIVADEPMNTIAARLGQANLEDVYLHLNDKNSSDSVNAGA
jgi:ABC-2 type transport system ATP-binding protein